jgi:hypothetical protein
MSRDEITTGQQSEAFSGFVYKGTDIRGVRRSGRIPPAGWQAAVRAKARDGWTDLVVTRMDDGTTVAWIEDGRLMFVNAEDWG